MSIRVEGFENKEVTQCFTCNNFNHISENCHINPRCLKCGEAHITRDCHIKQKLEIKYCINCQVYGHLANWQGCPCYPKPPMGAVLNRNKNTFTNIFNSIVRPNTSYAQAATQNTLHTNKSRQTAAHSTQRAGNSRQTEAITAQQINPIPIQNYPLNAATNISIQQTLQITMFALAQLSQVFSGASGIARNLNRISAAHSNPNQLYGLIEASLNNNFNA
ncbi:uncharacterized protein TNCT_710411 [Trichonephila clavata]|uniref:Uncharacterized protein n=1 Tax=Trichonephila clavata TaxID=2740835 RepID=A0A8X6H801_TRICU|nr:uncharacterized protein TNCT_710411 [Trichonephila clavata]